MTLHQEEQQSPRGPETLNGPHIRPILVAVLVGISFFLSAIFLTTREAQSGKPAPDSPLAAAVSTGVEASPTEALSAPPAGPQKAGRYDFRLSSTDTFYGIMSLFAITGPEIQDIATKSRRIFDLRHLKKDTVLRVTTSPDDRPETIEYMYSLTDGLVVTREPSGGYLVSRRETPTELKTVAASGSIDSTLYDAGVKAGVDPQVVLAMTDIFAWDVDFTTEIRKGDTFRILYEARYVNDRYAGHGRVLGAEMVNAGKKYTAVYFETGGRGGYYDLKGNSLSRTLLKSPLRYRRVSSRFTTKRFHPILKTFRPHHGVDYAAPSGTPVEAAGGGRVTYAGWRGGYGNFVEIRHSNGYVTGYGHLSRIAKGVRTGANIDQGELLGYVGSTGISTGPHLHYEISVNGKLINPLSIKTTPNKAVPKKEMARFASFVDEVRARLDGSTVVASAPAVNPSIQPVPPAEVSSATR